MAQATPSTITPILLSVCEAAALLGVSRWTITRLLDAGTLPAVMVACTRKILRSDIETWLDQQRAASIAAAEAVREERTARARQAAPTVRGRGRPRKPALAA